ncbi:hypothetical protein [Streptomyces sp. NPDC047014]|uniref:hypothetical protein n=1 Tax=Streptomyces sp. NPDC047014 TaxID=3155736 RepID=UPI0033FE1B73
MESPAENKRSAALALAVLGVLLIASLVVLVVFDGDDDTDDPSNGGKSPSAAAQDKNGDPGSGTGGTGDGGAARPATDSVPPIVTPQELAEAHRAMAAYMSGLSTYKYTDQNATWSKPLLGLTVADERMKGLTALPTGKDWDTCQAARCASTGKATVVRDGMIAQDLVSGGGSLVSSVVTLTSVRTENGKQTRTETNSWLVSTRKDAGSWKVSGFDLQGLGNVGSSDKTGD